MRLELTCVGLLVELANHYTTKGASLPTNECPRYETKLSDGEALALKLYSQVHSDPEW